MADAGILLSQAETGRSGSFSGDETSASGPSSGTSTSTGGDSGSRPDTPHSVDSLSETPVSSKGGELEQVWFDSHSSSSAAPPSPSSSPPLSPVEPEAPPSPQRSCSEEGPDLGHTATLRNAQQEISQIRREHALELASVRHDSEHLRRQVLELKKEAEKKFVDDLVSNEQLVERYETEFQSRVAQADRERALAVNLHEAMSQEALLAREQLRAERLGIHNEHARKILVLLRKMLLKMHRMRDRVYCNDKKADIRVALSNTAQDTDA